ncbi:hypothetical protein LCGC14_0311280 [marine sediment metagenome]|uniref:Uncharacterized protein n=1 Tax=marine sediment metagenome TaxID=412755 RepID=A0A0F9TMF5_9ZZZZ
MVAPIAVAGQDEKVFDLRFTLRKSSSIESASMLIVLLVRLFEDWSILEDPTIEDITNRHDRKLDFGDWR